MASLEIRPGVEMMVFGNANAMEMVDCDGPKAVGTIHYLQSGRPLTMKANFHLVEDITATHGLGGGSTGTPTSSL